MVKGSRWWRVIFFQLTGGAILFHLSIGSAVFFSLYFLPPPFLVLKKKPKALRHTFSTIGPQPSASFQCCVCN